MALNFTISYTFSPGTTIASSQVNTNTSDVANVFTGLEALTKTLAKLKVDVDPTTALEVATKQYVDHYSTWRRPVLQYGSATTVAVESGLDGTSGNIPILFPDGTLRTETSTTRTTFVITRNAVLVTSGAQSGLTGATSEATNTWYALYAVKVTDSSTLWVTVGSTVLPLQANYATLNTAYGTNGWVYLGMIRNGDQSGATGDILDFKMAGNVTLFSNNCATNTYPMNGIAFAGSASATGVTWTAALGTAGKVFPNHVTAALWSYATTIGGNGLFLNDNVAIFFSYAVGVAATGSVGRSWLPKTTLQLGLNSGAGAIDLNVSGFIDGVLGVGSNPIL